MRYVSSSSLVMMSFAMARATFGRVLATNTLRRHASPGGCRGRLQRGHALGKDPSASRTVMSWSEGPLVAQDSADCRVRIRLAAPRDSTEDGRSTLFRQLIGEREFSPGHPAMQALNPSVYELFFSTV